MESQSAAIRFLDLKKNYKEGFWRRDRPALRGVSFDVPLGQIFGFLGANGAGKTTSIKIALGLQSATSGSVEILGRPAGDVETKARLGFLPERPYFHTNLSAEEFLDFHRGLYGPAPAGRKRPTNEELLNKVGLLDARHRQLRSFSKGMLQRIGLAQALINDPDLVILDEPMSGLDPVGRREVRNLLLELNRAGKTIFFSSHILSDVESICQCIAFLEKGSLKYCGRIEDLFAGLGHQYEIFFRRAGADSQRLASLGKVEPSGAHERLLVAGEKEARQAVEKLWTAGAEVVSFSPVHRSLEDVLFGEAREGGIRS